MKTEEHHLDLANAVAVEVEFQLQLGQCGGDDFSVCGSHKFSEACDEGGDMFPFEFRFFGPL